ncbi:hypothetical protein Gpo141_00001062 [Globisporangium polare]
MLESILPRFLYGSSSPSTDATSNAARDGAHKPVAVAAGSVSCCTAEDKDMDDEWVFLAPATISTSTATAAKPFSKVEATRAAAVLPPGRSYADVVAGRDKKEV